MTIHYPNFGQDKKCQKTKSVKKKKKKKKKEEKNTTDIFYPGFS